jgi:hypothetical protein
VRWSLVAWFAALGCGDTAIVIEVTSNGLSVPDELDAFCLAAWDVDPAGGEFARTYALGGEVDDLPQSLTVEPGQSLQLLAVARGYRDGREVARARASVEFSGVTTATLSLSRCASGSPDAPAVVGGVAVAAGTRVATSFGRVGSLVVAVGPASSEVYRATDGGMMAAGLSAPPVSAEPGPRDLIAFDSDGDCDDDLLLVPASAPPAVWRRDGAGSFSAVEDALPSGLTAGRAAAVADVDGDGDVDIAVAQDAGLVILLNDGGGRFTPSLTPIDGDAGIDVTAIAFGDLDGDGDADLVSGRGTAQPAAPLALLNAGTGAFVEVPVTLPDPALLARQLEVVDVTGDGFFDLLLGVSASHVRVYVNRADGLFEDRSVGTLPALDPIEPSAISGGDWDGDCRVDVVIGRADGGSALLWRGIEDGRLASEVFGAAASGYARLSDVDDDGARDLVIVDAGAGLAWVQR